MIDFFLFVNYTNVLISYLSLATVDEANHYLNANCSNFNYRK